MRAPNRYVALDVETTGFSPKNGDRVIEIGAVAIENQSKIKTLWGWQKAGMFSASLARMFRKYLD